MEQTTPYIYLITDISNGMRYIGSRTGVGCSPEDLGVSYFTSSSNVKPLYKADPSRFKKEILLIGNRDYVLDFEKKIIDLYGAVKSDHFYNRSNNRVIHHEDALKGCIKAHSVKDSRGKSVVSSKAGATNIASGWAAELGRRGKASGKLLLMASEAGKKGGKATMAQKWVCGTCGKTSHASGIVSHQKASGHSNRTRII